MKLITLVVFNLDNQKYALHLSTVETIIRAVEFTALPKVPKIVNGITNFQEKIIPVFNIRKRFNLPDKEIDLDDHLIIVHTSKRMAALIKDNVSNVISRSKEEIINANKILPEIKYIEEILRLKNGIMLIYILIHNLDKFLSLEEEKELENSMKGNISEIFF